eukprot:4920470-Prymnesium_polylepis.1
MSLPRRAVIYWGRYYLRRAPTLASCVRVAAPRSACDGTYDWLCRGPSTLLMCMHDVSGREARGDGAALECLGG